MHALVHYLFVGTKEHIYLSEFDNLTNFIFYSFSLSSMFTFFLFVSATGKVLASELPDNVGKSSSVLYPASLKASNEIGVCFGFLISSELIVLYPY